MLKKRLIIVFAVVTLLVSNFAWAWGNHVQASMVGEPAVVMLDGAGGPAVVDTLSEGEGEALLCNHYCSHGAAHLSGLLSAVVSLAAFQAEPVQGLPASFPLSPSLAQLFKPPRS